VRAAPPTWRDRRGRTGRHRTRSRRASGGSPTPTGPWRTTPRHALARSGCDGCSSKRSRSPKPAATRLTRLPPPPRRPRARCRCRRLSPPRPQAPAPLRSARAARSQFRGQSARPLRPSPQAAACPRPRWPGAAGRRAGRLRGCARQRPRPTPGPRQQRMEITTTPQRRRRWRPACSASGRADRPRLGHLLPSDGHQPTRPRRPLPLPRRQQQVRQPEGRSMA